MGSKLNEVRKELNISIEDFAKEMDCSVSMMLKLLYTKREPSAKLLRKLKKAYPQIDMNIFFE